MVRGEVLSSQNGAAERALRVGGAEWYTWLEGASSFAYRGAAGSFSATKERRARGGEYWTAYRRRERKLHRFYLGKSAGLTPERLEAAARTLAEAPTSDEPGRARKPHRPVSPEPRLVIEAKLSIPRPRADLVPRPRLLRQLDRALEEPLTLLTAPAGYGKSTLLAAWASAAARPVAWVSLDARDADPVRFWGCVASALGRLVPGVGTSALALLRSPASTPTELTENGVAALLDDLAGVSAGTVLALDDLHAVGSREVYNALASFVEHMPPTVRLIVASRSDPPLPLARLRARGLLAEVRTDDLRFTDAEAATFIEGALGAGFPDDTLRALVSRTEGWGAGLRLAALALAGRSDPSAFVAGFTGGDRYVLDYLLAEVLDRQTAEVRDFLLETSVLDRLGGELCDAVTRRKGGSAMLDRLEREGLFVTALDRERCWYRYHHLFGDALRSQLRRERPERVADLHRRASVWSEEHGFADEAITHALAAHDAARAADLVERAADAILWRTGEVATLAGWLAALPPPLLRERARLRLAAAWACVTTNRVAEADTHLQGLDDRADTEGLAPAVAGSAAAARARLALRLGEPARAEENAGRALELLPAEEMQLRTVATLLLGTARLRRGETEAAATAYEEAAALERRIGEPEAAPHAAMDLAALDLLRGRLGAAERTCRAGLRRVGGAEPSRGVRLPWMATFWGILAEVLYLRNELAEAERSAESAVALIRGMGATANLLSGYAALAKIRHARGDGDGARRALEEAERSARSAPNTTMPVYAGIAAAWLRLATGDVTAAEEWARTLDPVHGVGGPSPETSPADRDLAEARVLTLAWLRILQGRPVEALVLLRPLRAGAEAAGRALPLIQLLALEALARCEDGEEALALDALRRSLALAEPQGLVRPYVDLGEPMSALLRLALARGIAPAYTRGLISAFPGRAAATEPPEGNGPERAGRVPEQEETLTASELRVLRLVAEGYSNAEVARELVLSPNTVKSHLKRVYEKLGVRSRARAVRAARLQALL
jgi:LuxR family maltose regulon positive regulatory protein